MAFYANDMEKKIAYISNIGVDIHYQRNRIGSRLMQKSIAESRDKGMEIIRLEVLKTNEKAISFYKHWGFTVEAKGDKDTCYMSRYL